MIWIVRTVGASCMLVSAVLLVRTASFLHHASRADGVIVAASPHPSVRFSNSTGHQTEFVQNGFVSRPLGSTVPVAYDPRDPAQTARVVTFWTTWGSAAWLLPFGAAATFSPWLWPAREP